MADNITTPTPLPVQRQVAYALARLALHQPCLWLTSSKPVFSALAQRTIESWRYAHFDFGVEVEAPDATHFYVASPAVGVRVPEGWLLVEVLCDGTPAEPTYRCRKLTVQRIVPLAEVLAMPKPDIDTMPLPHGYKCSMAH